MIAIQIEDTKAFMNKLLKDTLFDDFDVISVDLSTLISFSIDGKINQDFLDTSEKEMLGNKTQITWEKLKPTIYHILKGTRTPTTMKIVFSLSQKSKEALILRSGSSIGDNVINGFTINIVYDHKTLKMITGTNYKIFTLDKTIEEYFDKTILQFLAKHEIVISR